MADVLTTANGLAGVAALVNSLILWPMYRTLKAMVIESHEPRITALEQKAPKAKATRKPKRRR